MDSQTPAALTLGPGGNDPFYDESRAESDPGKTPSGGPSAGLPAAASASGPLSEKAP